MTYQNHQIAYWQDGPEDASEVILFVHGFPSAAWDWHNQWTDLKEKYRLITLDLLGYGLSDKPHPHQYSLLEQADIIEALVKNRSITHCHILAHDYGDSVTQELLARHCDNTLGFCIENICFLNGGLFPQCHRPVLAQKLLKSPLGPLIRRFLSKKSLRKSFTQIFGPDSPPSEQDINVLWELMQENQGTRVVPSLLGYIEERRVHAEKWLRAMQRTKVPLYLINGVYDPVSGQHMLDHYINVVPEAKVTPLPVGHYPQIESADSVTRYFRSFIST